MTNFIKRSSIFLLLFVVSNFSYLLLIQKTDWNFKKRIESLNLVSPKIDVLVLGNSLAMDGVDTRLLTENGFRAYNLAIGGSSLKTNYIQLEEYIAMYEHKPKYVILGLGSYMSSFLDPKETLHPIVDFTLENKKFGIKDIPMVKFNWLFEELLKKIVSKKHRNAYLEYGQLKFRKSVTDNTTFNPLNKFPIQRYINSTLLQDFIKLCSLNNIQLIVVEMPGFKNVRHQKRLDYTFLNKDQTVGILLDCNNVEFCEIFEDNKDWIGNSHLNEYGAIKFTDRLLQKLKNINKETYQF